MEGVHFLLYFQAVTGTMFKPFSLLM